MEQACRETSIVLPRNFVYPHERDKCTVYVLPYYTCQVKGFVDVFM